MKVVVISLASDKYRQAQRASRIPWKSSVSPDFSSVLQINLVFKSPY